MTADSGAWRGEGKQCNTITMEMILWYWDGRKASTPASVDRCSLLSTQTTWRSWYRTQRVTRTKRLPEALQPTNQESNQQTNSWNSPLRCQIKLDHMASPQHVAGRLQKITLNMHVTIIMVHQKDYRFSFKCTMHCCKTLPQERDHSMVSCLGEETGVLMEQIPEPRRWSLP